MMAQKIYVGVTVDYQDASFSSFRHHMLDQGAALLVRLDLNVPCHQGRILNEARIDRASQTLRLFKNHRLVLLTHWGRPKGYDESSSVAFLVPILSKAIHRPVAFAQMPEDVCEQNPVTLLENIRFFAGETTNDAIWIKKLSKLADVFINEAFSASHRAHGSIVGLPSVMPSFMGPVFEGEWHALKKLKNRLKEGQAVALVGGSKVSTKIGVLKNLLEQCDYVLIGGGMGNTFLAAQGKDMAQSFVENEGIPIAKDMLQKWGRRIVLPVDGVEMTSHHVTTSPRESWGDIGRQTLDVWCQYLSKARTIFWNGPMGAYEYKPLDQGSRSLAHFLDLHNRQPNVYSVAGGGDTLAVIGNAYFSYASPSGGAFLEALETGSLPGIDALMTSSLFESRR